VPVDHIGVDVPDLSRAKSYYDALMPALDYEEFFSAEEEFSYRPVEQKPGTFVFFYAHTAGHQQRPQHLAFAVKTRAAVESAFAKAIACDSEAIHHPQLFPQYHENYYAAFWLDPFGMTLEAVCHKPE
jgi:catechol 2,3-dioxygenase-like lactoylglutathione lyase family enzyme